MKELTAWINSLPKPISETIGKSCQAVLVPRIQRIIHEAIQADQEALLVKMTRFRATLEIPQWHAGRRKARVRKPAPPISQSAFDTRPRILRVDQIAVIT